MLNVNIEPTGYCNSKCYYCGNNQDHLFRLRYKKFLPVELHKKLFSGLKQLINNFYSAPNSDKKVYLRYCGVGEPTLHGNFLDMFEEGLRFPNVSHIVVLSNGSEWNKSMVDRFVSIAKLNPNKLIELVFSLDTIRIDTQFKIKRLSNILEINRQLFYLLEQKASYNLKNLHPVFQMIVLEENLNQVSEFCGFWLKNFANLGLNGRIVTDPTYGHLFSNIDCFIWIKAREPGQLANERYDKTIYEKALEQTKILMQDDNKNITTPAKVGKIKPASKAKQVKPKYEYVCSMMWYGVNLASNGDISPCCFDASYNLKVGNIAANSLLNLYAGDAMIKLRMAHINKDLEDFPVCRDCPVGYKGIPVKDSEVIEFLRLNKTSELQLRKGGSYNE